MTTDRWTFYGLGIIVLLGHSLQPCPIEVLYNGEQLANGEKSSCGKLHDGVYVGQKEVTSNDSVLPWNLANLMTSILLTPKFLA